LQRLKTEESPEKTPRWRPSVEALEDRLTQLEVRSQNGPLAAKSFEIFVEKWAAGPKMAGGKRSLDLWAWQEGVEGARR